ncbi:MAG TPA: Ig-like domain-containing protein [Gemmatimonadales bacterium]|jgi:uncharacterized protein YjdB
MLKVYRNVFVSGVLALGLAACGDKVTVTQPTTPPPGVTSVQVTPQNASVGIGQTIQLAATVVADSGISTGLNWASSTNGIATVDQTGKVTGIAVGTTTVTATSVINPARSAAVQITVTNSSTFNVTPPTLNLAPGQTSNLSVTMTPAVGQVVSTPIATSLSTTIATAGTCSAVTGNASSCPITGVSQGTAVVTVVDSIGGVAFTQTVTINVGAAASISIGQIAAGATAGNGNCTGVVGAPVILTDVNCQIDVTLNLTAGIQPLDSLNVYMQHGTVAAGQPVFQGRATPTCAASAAPCAFFKRAAQQIYGASIPSSGPITLSINTANFTKNVTKGTATVDWFNGAGALITQIFPHGIVGGAVFNCQIGANDPSCAVVNTMVLNNADGWAADITKCGGTINGSTVCPAADPVAGKGGFAIDSAGAGSNVGKTYWGGPGVTGEVTAQLYAVVYNDNPSAAPGSSNNRCNNQLGDGSGCISTVNWTLGSTAVSFGHCDFTTQSATTSPATPVFKQVFGSTGADVTNDCSGHQNVLSRRDNILVQSGALDAQSNNFATNTLIPNIVVPNATPDSLRLDWAGPDDVQRPSGEGWEFQHWVNANWQFNHFGTEVDDGGVGPAPATWTAFVGPNFTTVIHTGADLAETNTNTTDGYTARASAADRLGNSSTSAVTTAFGVDKTAPMLRYSTTTAPSSYASIYVGGGAATVLDSTTYNAFQGLYGANVVTAGQQDLFLAAAAGTNDSVRVESTDNRSGVYRGIEMVNDFAQGGATGATTTPLSVNFTINDFPNTTIGFLPSTIDGWLPLHAEGVTAGLTTPGYYTTTAYVVDKAGNASGCPDTRATDGANGGACTAAAASSTNLFARRTLALDPGQPQVTGVSPNNSYVGNSPAIFTLGSQNDLEVIDAKLRLLYPNLTIGDGAGTIPAAGAGGLVWTYALSGTFMTGTAAGSHISSGPAAGVTGAFGFFDPIAKRFDNSIINPSVTPLTLDLFTTNVQETCTGTTGTATGPTTATDCGGGSAQFVGDPIPTDAGGFALQIPSNVGVQVRDVFGSWIFNTVASPVTGVSNEFVSPILSATVTPPVTTYGVSYTTGGALSSCPAGGAVQPAGSSTCVTGSNSINFRADNNLTSGSTKVFRATEALSRSLPIFGRVDLFGLNAQQQWVFIARIVVPNPVAVSASCPAATPSSTGVVGCDNGLERYWLYTFAGVPAGFTEYRAIGVDSHGSGLASTIHN